MSCYFRHLKDIFSEAGIEVTPANRKKVDQAIHQIVRVDYKECPSAWKNIKQEMSDDENRRQDFIQRLKNAISS
jgi:predicted Fe-Mo cluster-binding NifX family protein